MTNLTALLIPAIVVLLRLYAIPAVRDVAEKFLRRQIGYLPPWAQPIPPLVLSVLGVFVGMLSGQLPEQPAVLVSSAGAVWLGAVGLHHVAKRFAPKPLVWLAGLVSDVKAARKE